MEKAQKNVGGNVGADYDAVIVGSGPNGLAAAITLARAKQRILLLEAKATLGGGMRTIDVDGFKHDICSAIHPLALASPFFREIMPELEQYGLEWCFSPVELAHTLDDRTVLLYRDLARTASELGRDGAAYRQLFAPLLHDWQGLLEETLRPLLHMPRLERLLSLMQFGARALPPATLLTRIFRDEPAKALVGGLAAHSILPLHAPATSAIGMMLGLMGHAVGWGFPKGGTQALADSMVAYFRALGGTVMTDAPVQTLAQIGTDYPSARAIFLNTDVRQVLSMAGESLPSAYRRRLQAFRYGAGAFKLDFALNAPIPWRDAQTAQAATVHVGGTFAEMVQSERWLGAASAKPAKPYVLLAQQGLFDEARAPTGKHSVWAYCHVPHNSSVDMREAIIQQISRFAPDFPDTIVHTRVMNPQDYAGYNWNYYGGDINAGAASLGQMLARPTVFSPYETPVQGLYLCSASTPPAGGVHGMAGYHAARKYLQKLRHVA